MSKDIYPHLPIIAGEIVETVIRKDAEYGSSWMKRGGVGAFFMLARKWDRIENQTGGAFNWDVFEALMNSDEGTGLLDDIRDLVGYLLLVEGWYRLQKEGAVDKALVRGMDLTPGAVNQIMSDGSLCHIARDNSDLFGRDVLNGQEFNQLAENHQTHYQWDPEMILWKWIGAPGTEHPAPFGHDTKGND